MATSFQGRRTIFLLLLQVASGADYLMTFPGSTSSSIMAVTGETDGKYDVIYADGVKVAHNMSPFSAHTHSVRSDMLTSSTIETKAIIVRVANTSGIKIYGKDITSTYNPLPLSALGKIYMVSSCQDSKSTDLSLIVIATHDKNTDVSITVAGGNITHGGRVYTNGDTISVSLGQFQTVSLESLESLTSTIVDSVEDVAVYSGTRRNGNLVAYDQLLPVEHLGKNFFVAFDESVIEYTAAVTSVTNDTHLNSSSVRIGSFFGSLSLKRSNGFICFKTSEPIATVLCGTNLENGTDMSVLPSLDLYPRQSVLPLLGERLLILTLNDTDTINFKSSSVLGLSVRWFHDNISGLNIGVLPTPYIPSSSFEITSTGAFYVTVLSEDHIYHGGYFFPFVDGQEEEEDEDDMDIVIVGVAAGTGLATTTGMLVGGFVVYRRRRRRDSDRDREARNDKTDDKNGKKKPRRDDDPPPPPPRVPV